jgi:hypothetical protein
MDEGVTRYVAISPTTRVLMLITPLVAIGAVVWIATRRDGRVDSDMPLLAPFLLIGVMFAYGVFRAAHTIVLREFDGSAKFHTFFGVRIISAAQIQSVLPVTAGSAWLILKHAHGSVVIAGHFSGLHEVLEWIRQRNPEVRFKGM